ncbi:DNA adenine methylase [Alistipes onderdonkii]|uniref:DNA adenine methylase n=1 Tax=Alistipes onderdonkii TaxID=328813 RepID=UPI002109C8D5|nr:DNA adenine methylase [Alistipes onderdonkii]MCQ4881398.1 DNA adenine methylase [Alistipes onderdonkii]
MSYGLPYKGSKNSIAKWVISNLPASHTFVDLFAGGCAVTHAAILSGKFGRFIANDITEYPQVFRDAIDGKYRNECRWISREDFFRLKDIDPYVRLCWSFGNGMRSYLYDPEVERFKKHLHAVFFAGTPTSARLAWKGFVREFAKVRKEIEDLTQKVLKLCEECGVAPQYNADGTLNTKAIHTDVFRVKSAYLRKYLQDALKLSGLTQKDVDRHLGNYMGRHYFSESQWMLPTSEQYEKLQEILPALTIPWAFLNESLQRLQRLESLQSLESLQRLQSLEILESLESLQSLQSLESLQRLQRLESLESLQSLQSLERLKLSRKDYSDVAIPPGATVYCDPPYANTTGYIDDFDHERFYRWLRSMEFPVFVSEYSMPDDFICFASIDKACTFSPSKTIKRVEKMFVHERWADAVRRPDDNVQGRLF